MQISMKDKLAALAVSSLAALAIACGSNKPADDQNCICPPGTIHETQDECCGGVNCECVIKG